VKSITRDDLLAARPTPRPVTIPELGGQVWIRPLSGLERDAFEEHQYQRRRAGSAPNFRGGLVVRTLVTESGERVFADADEEIVGKLDGAVLDRITEAASKASGYTEKDVQALGEDSSASR
jgi:hypothetical protein